MTGSIDSCFKKIMGSILPLAFGEPSSEGEFYLGGKSVINPNMKCDNFFFKTIRQYKELN